MRTIELERSNLWDLLRIYHNKEELFQETLLKYLEAITNFISQEYLIDSTYAFHLYTGNHIYNLFYRSFFFVMGLVFIMRLTEKWRTA